MNCPSIHQMSLGLEPTAALAAGYYLFISGKLRVFEPMAPAEADMMLAHEYMRASGRPEFRDKLLMFAHAVSDYEARDRARGSFRACLGEERGAPLDASPDARQFADAQ